MTPRATCRIVRVRDAGLDMWDAHARSGFVALTNAPALAEASQSTGDASACYLCVQDAQDAHHGLHYSRELCGPGGCGRAGGLGSGLLCISWTTNSFAVYN